MIRLKTLEERKEREQELALAQQTQESLLPRSLPQFENYRIHAYNNPTRYVGGDFYDFLQLSSGDWMGVLADVSGKGMSAALLSSMVLGALSMEFHSGTRAPGGPAPGEPAALRKISSRPVRHALSLSAEPAGRGAIHQRGT